MKTIWHPSAINYLQKKSLAPNDGTADMVATLRDYTPVSPTVQKLAAEFLRGSESLKMTQSLEVLQLPPK